MATNEVEFISLIAIVFVMAAFCAWVSTKLK
jgi:hypothetical protein